MELISLIAALIAATFIGFNILYLVAGGFNNLYLLETVFISYGLGVGFISLEMLVFYLAGLKFSVPGILAPWALLVAVNAYRYLKNGNKLIFNKQLSGASVIARAEGPKQSSMGTPIFPQYFFRKMSVPIFNAFLASGITLEVVYAFFRALIKPIEAYDAVAIYAIKSKIFFLAKAIPETYFPSLVHGFPHPDYPLNIPLTETFMYMVMRNLNDQLVKAIFPLFFLGILCILYFAIRRFASRTYALLFTFLLASIPMFNSYAANAYQELPLAFYCFVSVVFLLAWIENREDLGSLVMSAVMVALAGWTKNEGVLYCAINAFIVFFLSIIKNGDTSHCSVFQKRDVSPFYAFYAPILYLAVIGIILAPWIWIKARFGIMNDDINLLYLNPAYLLKQLPKLGPIFYELQKQLFGPKKWILLWPIAIFAAVFNYKKIFSGAQKYISVSLILAFCGYVVSYMISYVDVVFFASKTWGRFLLHFLPLLVLWLAYMLKEDIKV